MNNQRQRYWLLITTPSRWDVLRKQDPVVWGFKEGKALSGAFRIQVGDRVLIYLTREQKIVAAGTVRTNPQTVSDKILFDEVMPVRTTISIDIEQPVDSAVPVKNVKGVVSFIPNIPRWGAALQRSFREISAEDFNAVLHLLADTND